MKENLNMAEPNKMSDIGSTDSDGQIAPASIGTSIAATITVCSKVSAATLATVQITLTLSDAFSCGKGCK